MNKICPVCKKEFILNKYTIKIQKYCSKLCYQKAKKEYMKKYNEKYNETHKEQIRKHFRELYKNNPEKYRNAVKKSTNKHKKRYQIRQHNYWVKNKKRRLIYKKLKYNNDSLYRIKTCLRVRIRAVLKGIRKAGTTSILIGCPVEFLKQHLEKHFKPGMSWKNMGKWHIDHIRPCASFDLSKVSEQRKCFHYTNLQPLWAEENLKKQDKYK